MNLGYRIVWVDDSPDWVEPVQTQIEEYLIESGYEPNIETLLHGKELNQKCTEADLDLIIIDYNLSHDEKGDQLISDLRDAGSFTEIVFYSQQWPADGTIEEMDSVFRCIRDDAVDKIIHVIGLTLHKFKDLGVVRGLVITAAIDLEIKLEQLMVLVFGKQGDVFRERVLEKQLFDFAKKAAFIQGIVKDRINNCEPGETKGKLEAASATMKKFVDEVVITRNTLAHSQRAQKDGHIVLEGLTKQVKDVKFDAEWLAKMRADLRKHQENLDSLEKLLTETA